MRTYNEEFFPCPPQTAFALARQVDRWPERLPHYRWVKLHAGDTDRECLVEMAARRDFGKVGWPVWWLSRMWVDPERMAIRYRHVDGVTRGMSVLWLVEPAESGSRVSILHEWPEGPRFAGLLAPAVGRSVVGPLFVHFIAGRTLAQLAEYAQRERTP